MQGHWPAPFDTAVDTTAQGRSLKVLNVIDEFTRECLSIHDKRSIDADQVVATLERLGVIACICTYAHIE